MKKKKKNRFKQEPSVEKKKNGREPMLAFIWWILFSPTKQSACVKMDFLWFEQQHKNELKKNETKRFRLLTINVWTKHIFFCVDVVFDEFKNEKKLQIFVLNTIYFILFILALAPPEQYTNDEQLKRSRKWENFLYLKKKNLNYLSWTEINALLEDSLWIIFVHEWSPIGWSSCSQECDHFFGI